MPLRPLARPARLRPRPARARAQSSSGAFSPSQVEAVYLFNFAHFVEWPAQAFGGEEAPLVIGILGRDPFGRALDEVVRDERIGRHPIVIRRVARVREAADCHILFISQSEAGRLDRILEELQNHPVLTVSDIPDFARRGGIIQFVEDRDHVRFRIDLRRAKADALEISAKLLRPAEVISRLVPGWEQALGGAPLLRRESLRLIGEMLPSVLSEFVHESVNRPYSPDSLIR